MAEQAKQDEHTGHRWGVYGCYDGPFDSTQNNDGSYSVSLSTQGRKPTGYAVMDMFGKGGERYRFKSEKAAQRRADELNRLDWQGPLDPAFKARRNRLKRLSPDFGSWMYEGPAAARWPVRPQRYLIQGHDDGWHGEAWDQLKDTLDEVRETLESDIGHEVWRVVDLGTGSEVEFERHVSAQVGSNTSPTHDPEDRKVKSA
jgi:hypothetical protein